MSISITEQEDKNYFITCSEHPSYTKTIKRSHKTTQAFCTLCRQEERIKSFREEFIKTAQQLYLSLYNYDNVIYVNNRTPVEIHCNKHTTVFKQRPADHLSGKTGCPDCIFHKQSNWQLKPFELFKEKAIEIHNNKFEYIDTNYKGNHCKLQIKCNIHNHIFEQTPAHHLEGKNGCELCKNKGRRWSKEDFITAFSHKQCTFYVIQCHDEHESFYKLGITSKTVKQRYNKHNLPYQYTIILEYKDTAENVWDLEYMFKQKFKNYYYKPIQEFRGSSTETFKLEKQQLKDILFHTDNIMIK